MCVTCLVGAAKLQSISLFEENEMNDRNFVAKHMKQFCKGGGSHVNMKRKSLLQGNLEEDLSELTDDQPIETMTEDDKSSYQNYLQHREELRQALENSFFAALVKMGDKAKELSFFPTETTTLPYLISR